MSRGSTIAERGILVASLLVLADPAYAYIDPGTGAMVTTAILGFFASIAYTFRKYMYRIKDLFTRKRPASEAKAKDGTFGR